MYEIIYQIVFKVQDWIFFNNQLSRKQWLGLRLVLFLHQKVISKVAILFDISLINLTCIHILLAMKTVCDKFGALFILDEVGGLSYFLSLNQTSCWRMHRDRLCVAWVVRIIYRTLNIYIFKRWRGQVWALSTPGNPSVTALQCVIFLTFIVVCFVPTDFVV